MQCSSLGIRLASVQPIDVMFVTHASADCPCMMLSAVSVFCFLGESFTRSCDKALLGARGRNDNHSFTKNLIAVLLL